MKTVKIYSLNCPITYEVRYIGKTSLSLKQRLNTHMQCKLEKNHRYYWLKSLKEKGLKPSIELVDEVGIDNWEFWEQWYILLFKQWGFNLVNCSEGGEGFKENHIPWNKGKTNIHSKEALKKLSLLQKGKHVSNETKLKISLALKGKKKPNRSKAHAKKIALANTGKTAWNKGIKLTNEQKRVSKKVVQYSTDMQIIKKWVSVESVSKNLSINPSNIRSVCNGKRVSAGGFIWKYE